jgi:hypothetical protein
MLDKLLFSSSWVPLHFCFLLLHRVWRALVAKHCQNNSPPTHGELERRISGRSLLPLPRWNEGMEDVTEPYIWPNMKALPVVALGFTILRSRSDRLCMSSSTTFVRECNLCYRSTRVRPSKTTAYSLQPSPRQDHGYLVVHFVGTSLFSMLRIHQWY